MSVKVDLCEKKHYGKLSVFNTFQNGKRRYFVTRKKL